MTRAAGGTSRSYVYDAAGNPTTIGALTYVYNNANRLITVKNGATVVTSYKVNALGQRVEKNVGEAECFRGDSRLAASARAVGASLGVTSS